MSEQKPRESPPPCRWGPSLEWGVPLALAAIALLFFWKIALTNRVLAGLDVFAYFYPYRAVVSEAIRSGRLPLWNPYLFMGAPLLANSQAAVLYPLHWPLVWLSAPKQVAWSIVLHLWLGATGTYLFSRRVLHLRPLASGVAACTFALGGFLSAQVEHLNQLNTSTWLPWLLLCLEGSRWPGRQRWLTVLAGTAIVGLILLAGHTQAAYIVLAGAAVYSTASALARGPSRTPDYRPVLGWASALGQPLGWLALITLAGLVLGAGQILPTLELSRLSVRSGGLPYQEAASFSLKPTLLFKAFLPPYAWEPPFSEFVAYIGLSGLALAFLGAWRTLKRRVRCQGEALSRSLLARPVIPHPSVGVPALVLALLGIFLALGAYNPVYYLLYHLVPGFDLFRAPARWLLLYAFGAAILSSIGFEHFGADRRWKVLIALLLGAELFIAGRRLAYNQPTAPIAYESMRTAPAHLLAEGSAEPSRFLSLPGILYDPGDLQDIQAMYEDRLPENAVYSLVVAAKMKEVLAFNLSMIYGLEAVDGYDGGLLPTAQYVKLERLFLEEDEIWPDGRLRQQLQAIPPARLLALLNVRHVITDKMQDVWVDGVYYDLEHSVQLGQVTLTDLPEFEATHLGVVSYLTGTVGLADGTPVAVVTVTAANGQAITFTLRAGEDTAEGLHSARAGHRQPRVVHRWRDNDQGADYLTKLALEAPLVPRRLQVRSLLPTEGSARVILRGLSLVDARTGASRFLSVDPAFRLVHSGDVKIYENLSVLPRAFVVGQAQIVEDEHALALLSDPAFDLAREVLLAPSASIGGNISASPANGTLAEALLLRREPERVDWQVSLDSPGYLVFTDSWYPGWEAEVDGVSRPIERADLYFRAVALDAGTHLVSFTYRPGSVSQGLRIAIGAWLGWGLALLITALGIGRKRKPRV